VCILGFCCMLFVLQCCVIVIVAAFVSWLGGLFGRCKALFCLNCVLGFCVSCEVVRDHWVWLGVYDERGLECIVFCV